jgi:hypothetical protein
MLHSSWRWWLGTSWGDTERMVRDAGERKEIKKDKKKQKRRNKINTEKRKGRRAEIMNKAIDRVTTKGRT